MSFLAIPLISWQCKVIWDSLSGDSIPHIKLVKLCLFEKWDGHTRAHSSVTLNGTLPKTVLPLLVTPLMITS